MDNTWIQLAMEALVATHIADKQAGTCSRTYRRNISSLGASIIQMGLVPSLLSFSRTDDKAGNEPHLIVAALKHVIVKSGCIPDLKMNDDLALYAFNHCKDAHLSRSIDRALMALKLAIRMFEESDSHAGPDVHAYESNYFETAKNKEQTVDENILKKTETVHNMGWYFTRRYYRDIRLSPDPLKIEYTDVNGKKKERQIGNEQEVNFRKYNRSLFQTSLKKEWVESNMEMIKALGGGEAFRLATTYPGLMIGTGLHHGTSGLKNDLKMGFQFDYTTGLPYIPGSSLKGVLRSMFPKTVEDGKRCKYVRSKLPVALKSLTDTGIVALGEDIFEQGKDIFFDALIVDSKAPDCHILGEDYITPHRDVLKNPIPLQIIKVLPCVVFAFSFCLQESKIECKQVAVADKIRLFHDILLDVGVGAKTNTGYGQFVEEKKSNIIAGWYLKKHEIR